MEDIYTEAIVEISTEVFKETSTADFKLGDFSQ